MPRSDATLNLLADVATIRGRRSDAAHLRDSAGAGGTSGPETPAVVREALADIRDVGAKRAVTNALRDVPGDIRLLIKEHVVDVPTAARLASTGIVTLADLETAIEHHPELVPESVLASRHALPGLRQSRTPFPLGRAWDTLEEVVAAVREADPDVTRADIVGSTRRFATFSADLEILVSSTDPERTVGRLSAGITPQQIRHATPGRLVLSLDRSEIGVHIVTPDVFAVALFHLTGSRKHVDAVRGRAAQRGISLDWWSTNGPRTYQDEADVYAAVDLPFIAPELREGDGEIEAAVAGTLPTVLTVADMRGDLHMHTDWSDGRHSIDVMVDAAEALGYEYVAVTDHSKTSAIARGLDEDRLSEQRDAIRAARERHPRITILHGAEVDILRDGSLDFPDAVLESLDVVLASLHDPGSDSGSRLTDRYIAAMRNPLVQIVTHPTNRMVPGRAGYVLDEQRFFDAAVETGTIVEIDGAPGHLDMDGAMARRAIAAGVDVSVDGDCHRAERLGHQMMFGVGVARRGWVTAPHVVNTRPLAALRARLARKRTRS